ncbi:hypothetical protein TGAMA5MH_11072 [Trichoderma gamsii]|uniref:Uncharacterized protein n=1 Tax=Trichoderma gamsii TaxID=398673 RepID=A0A2K0SUT3_9HYPO|nr:hypothetical protein TGAMA5MH_11072 [Trichoderma gamsii]
MDDFPAAFEAAAAILAEQNRPQTRGQRPLSVRAAAVRFSASPSAVQRAISSLQTPDPMPRSSGQQRGGFPATKSQLVGAANDLRRRRDPEIGDLGKMWYSR